MDWTGQVAIVTGGSRGIGRAIAGILAARGAAVCVNYAARAADAEAVVADIAAAGGRAIAVQADVADAAAVAAMAARASRELGPVTILVNNAGVSVPATLDTYDPAAMQRMRRVNVDGVINTVRAVLPEHARARLWADRQRRVQRGDRHGAAGDHLLRRDQGRGADPDAPFRAWSSAPGGSR